MGDPALEARIAHLEDELANQREFLVVIYDVMVRTHAIMIAAGRCLTLIETIQNATEDTRRKL